MVVAKPGSATGTKAACWFSRREADKRTASYYDLVRMGCLGDHRLADRDGCVIPSLSVVSTGGLAETCSGVINRRSKDPFKLQVKMDRCSLTHLSNLASENKGQCMGSVQGQGYRDEYS